MLRSAPNVLHVAFLPRHALDVVFGGLVAHVALVADDLHHAAVNVLCHAAAVAGVWLSACVCVCVFVCVCVCVCGVGGFFLWLCFACNRRAIVCVCAY